MKACGITAEYNPLHNGHVHHLIQTRCASLCDAVVVAMSGDFVQRGEPAILDKWTRCSLALEAGADLVVEIPTLFCLGNAGQYARASVTMLEAVGCSDISFGSECGDADLLLRTADKLNKNKKEIEQHISGFIKEGMSYPAARAKAYREISAGVPAEQTEREVAILSSPNDILALEYILSMASAEPFVIKREGSMHGSAMQSGNEYQSAGAIRDALRSGTESIKDHVPDCTYKAILAGRPVFADDYLQLLRYSAEMTAADLIEECPSAGEGLGNLLKASAHTHDTWEGIISGAKSKRYTYTRISRLCMQMILGIDRRKFTSDRPEYIRVLGFSEKGRELLSEIKREGRCGLPVITNINKESASLSDEASRMLQLDIQAADIYNMVSGRGSSGSDHLMSPVIHT